MEMKRIAGALPSSKKEKESKEEEKKMKPKPLVFIRSFNGLDLRLPHWMSTHGKPRIAGAILTWIMGWLEPRSNDSNDFGASSSAREGG